MKKRFLSLILVLAMMVGVFTPLIASAAEPAQTEAHKTDVVVHKIKVKNISDWPKKAGAEGADKTKYDGSELGIGYFGEGAEELGDVKFTYWKVTEADYKVLDADHKTYDNVKAVEDKLKELVAARNKGKQDEEKETVPASQTVTTDKDNGAKIEGLVDGYYWFVEDKDSVSRDGKTFAGAAAVPFGLKLPVYKEDGSMFGTGNDALHVYPKNTLADKPEIDKNFEKDHGLQVINDKEQNNNAGANYDNYQKEKARVTAELGKEVPYEVKTKVNAGSNYQTLNWKDTMTNGLTFKINTEDKNKSVTIKATTVIAEGKTGTAKEIKLTADTDYKLTVDDRGFTLSLTADGLKKVNAETHPETGEGVAVEFTLTYSAIVNKNAVVDIPEKNDIKLEYSNNKEEEKQPTPVTPQNGELKVTKTWGDGKAENIPSDVKVVYTITNGATTAAVTLDGTEKFDVDDSSNNTVFDLGNGITFEVTGKYAGTFKGEALKTGEWKISERVAGYNEAINGATAGTAAITNTKDEKNPTPLNPTEPEVEYYGKRFVKADANTGERLQGAEFVIKNNKNQFLALKEEDMTEAEKTALATAKTNYDNAVNAWNDAVKANPDTADDQIKVTIGEEEITGKTAVMAKIAELQGKYETAFKAAKNAYEWVADKNAANVVKLVSDSQGKFEIIGLEKGTYHLVETKAPGKYAKLNDQEFKVGPKTYTKHEDGVVYKSDEKAIKVGEGNISEAQRVDNKLISIPQTGGIGTIIFTAIGLAIMASAIIAIKKRQATEAR